MFLNHMVRYPDSNDSSSLVTKSVSVTSSLLRQNVEHIQITGREVNPVSVTVSRLWGETLHGRMWKKTLVQPWQSENKQKRREPGTRT